MRLGDFILEDAIIGEVRASTKKEVLAEMVASIVESGCLEPDSAESVVEALMRREEIGSTGIGHGVAIPHAKHTAVRRLIGGYAHSSDGVDYGSPDGQPVKALFLILWPDGVIGPHLEAIARVSQALKKPNFVDCLQSTINKKEIVELFAEADKEAQG